ncbi:envelope stress response protein PspG [Duffyella gerundensis]|uniref:Putative membrane protein n=1 Tax=Duffyella gerundensis TaxID=1619313 RepID=A0A0U5GRP7_9GAMM|nr:envelope stress response protein PspG [Duffyella gerundensis]QTO54551.1 envelope stress response protein PspG [Duffyella gerundensis]UCB29756.1 envelope stress response protein PspG [Duffyella gerundensis]CUU25426.1 putative membrane protein [Duffyella gerundensis]
MEILFVLGFFVMLMLTGVSLVGVIAALIMATALMVVGGLFAMVIKLLPWLLLAVAVAWIYRAVKKPKVLVRRRYMRF